MLPKVSCLCPTFARTHLLNEAVESFLRQDYSGEKELIVYNDFAEQEIKFSHPEVTVVNATHRLPSLGDKRNATAAYATGDFLLTWGDDDIHLPNRISRMVEFVRDRDLAFALEGPHYCLLSDKMHRKPGSTTGAHIVATWLYNKLGGVPDKDFGEDADFNVKVMRHLGVSVLPICNAEPAFIYRWHGTDRQHISGLGQHRETGHLCYQKLGELAQSLVKDGHEPSGVVVVTPNWSQDWQAIAAAA